jgi:dienelactone hydrolase
MEDLDYGFEMIRELPWVDQDRIVLMGISQGGYAVAAWNRFGFAAHIILAATCGGKQPQAPAGTPVLAVVGGKDVNSNGQSCKVSRQPKGSRSIVIPEAPHGISDLPETERAIEEFLNSL